MKQINLMLMLLLTAFISKAQTVDEIIQKHFEKTGGQSAWAALNSIKMKGSINDRSGRSDIESIYTKSGLSHGTREVKGKEIVIFAFDGETAWDTNWQTMKPEKKSEEDQIRAKKRNREFPSELFDYKKWGFEVELLGEENIKGVDCYSLLIDKGKIPKGGKETDDITIVYISKDKYLEVAKEDTYVKGDYEGILYSYHKDFREVDGLMFPFRTDMILEGREMSIAVDSYELNGKVNQSLFKFKE